MAIVIDQSPSDGQSLHYDLWHVARSSFYADPTLKLIFDVYIGSTFISRHKVASPPDVVISAFFNAAPIVRNYIANYFTPANSLVSINTDDIYIEYTIKYGEEYTSGGTVVMDLDQETSSHKVYNSYPKYLQGGSLVVMNGLDHKFLSERDLNKISIPGDGTLFLSYMKGSVGTSLGVTIQTYDDSNTLISSPFQVIPMADVKKLLVLRISKSILNALLAGSAPDNLSRYVVNIGNGTTTISANVNVTCQPKRTPIQLHFLNRLGGYETFSFDCVNREELDVDKQMFSKSGWLKERVAVVEPPLSPLDYVGKVSNFNSTTKVYRQTEVQYMTQHKFGYKLISDYVNEINYNWLKQLIASPIVYMENNGYFYPVTVVEKKWSQKSTTADKIFNLELTINSFQNIFSQFQ